MFLYDVINFHVTDLGIFYKRQTNSWMLTMRTLCLFCLNDYNVIAIGIIKINNYLEIGINLPIINLCF